MSIGENLQRIRTELEAACARAGRSRSDVRLMAVSKTHPVEAIFEAYRAGQRLFGENRVQEMQAKASALATLDGVDMHLIGPLQNNKAGKAAELFKGIDTLDSVKTAARLEAALARSDKVLPVLIEVKLSAEDTKHGLAPEHLPELLHAVAAMPHLHASGLMTVPPASENPEETRPYFCRLRALRDEHKALYPRLTELSMGMSGDFQIAVEEGSTTVRLGTAIFGQRDRS